MLQGEEGVKAPVRDGAVGGHDSDNTTGLFHVPPTIGIVERRRTGAVSHITPGESEPLTTLRG